MLGPEQVNVIISDHTFRPPNVSDIIRNSEPSRGKIIKNSSVDGANHSHQNPMQVISVPCATVVLGNLPSRRFIPSAVQYNTLSKL